MLGFWESSCIVYLPAAPNVDKNTHVTRYTYIYANVLHVVFGEDSQG